MPTLQLFVDGKAPAEEYPVGDRTWEKLTEFVEQQAKEYGVDAVPEVDDATAPNPDGVSIDLDNNGLEAVKQSGQTWFIKYYAPWCGHCQRLAPAWEQMAKDLQRQVNVGEVNCEIHRGEFR